MLGIFLYISLVSPWNLTWANELDKSCRNHSDCVLFADSCTRLTAINKKSLHKESAVEDRNGLKIFSQP
ncbi:MAG: hypothetical protein AB7H97_06735, partial [Pseudobdellovibrionaceae bacterium]